MWLCWHDYEKWSDPFQGTWNHYGDETDQLVDKIANRAPMTVVFMTQRRTCKKCGKVQYRKC